MGEFADAQTDFENILADNSNYVPALKGLSETCLSRARECYTDQRLGTARDYVQNSVNKATLYVAFFNVCFCFINYLIIGLFYREAN